MKEKKYNIGVWSKDEHNKLISALKLYGKDYQKMQAVVGTRSWRQIQSHMQKYYRSYSRLPAHQQDKEVLEHIAVDLRKLTSKQRKGMGLFVRQTPISDFL